MKNTHSSIKGFLAYYAKELGAVEVQKILEKKSIDSEHEAKSILNFLDQMCPKVAEDATNGVVVLNQVVHTTDAEKVCNVIEDYIEDAGYGDLLDHE